MNDLIAEIGCEFDGVAGTLADHEMAWTRREYDAPAVDHAGDALINENASQAERDAALVVVNNWRSCHGFALNTMQMNLRNRAAELDPTALVAQRTKRLPAVVHKLDRLRRLKLSQIQDIAGCRSVLKDVKTVRELRQKYTAGRMHHVLVHEDDYIERPKPSGYRGIHLVYTYQSDANTHYNGLRIELQIRSRLQHAWATTVETAQLFTSQYLKSSQGDERWLRFFALMGSAIAVRENSPIVPKTPKSTSDLNKELRGIEAELDARKRLEAYGAALQTVEPTGGDYFLLHLDTKSDRLSVKGYTKRDLPTAQAEYADLERNSIGKPHENVVLVAVGSVKNLRAAYPNYYLDTRLFVEALTKAIEE